MLGILAALLLFAGAASAETGQTGSEMETQPAILECATGQDDLCAVLARRIGAAPVSSDDAADPGRRHLRLDVVTRTDDLIEGRLVLIEAGRETQGPVLATSVMDSRDPDLLRRSFAETLARHSGFEF